MNRIGLRTRALLLEQRLTNAKSGRLYRARTARFYSNWKVMVF